MWKKLWLPIKPWNIHLRKVKRSTMIFYLTFYPFFLSHFCTSAQRTLAGILVTKKKKRQKCMHGSNLLKPLEWGLVQSILIYFVNKTHIKTSFGCFFFTVCMINVRVKMSVPLHFYILANLSVICWQLIFMEII